MRIVSGNYGGRVIHTPKNLPVRPTTDLAKESLFNILNNTIDFEELQVLDLFSGTGNISYEFYSRGSQSVTSVEQNFRCAKFIKETAANFKMEGLKVIQANAFSFLKHSNSYDIIFADPPYDFGRYEELTETIINNKILKENGMLIIEHPRDIQLSKFKGFTETRRYGKVHFSFFEYFAD
ncbi:MAG: 16S rRNA (guanine(966)-N(2))-methyltransferase RsmD [Bacteroidetes bacterium]|nr:MAG: 16S rRNA (guanine(966)-N(2))-methyltransferase RsmD [Bacteroidota bacterium]